MPLSPAAGQFDIAEGIDPGVEEAGEDGRGFVLDDDGGAGDERAGFEIPAFVDRYVDELAGFGVEHRAGASGSGRVWLGACCGGLDLHRAWRRKQQYPAEDFDLDPRDYATVETPIGFLEDGVKDRRVVLGCGIHQHTGIVDRRYVAQDLRQLVRAELAGSTRAVRQGRQPDPGFLVTWCLIHQASPEKES